MGVRSRQPLRFVFNGSSPNCTLLYVRALPYVGDAGFGLWLEPGRGPRARRLHNTRMLARDCLCCSDFGYHAEAAGSHSAVVNAWNWRPKQLTDASRDPTTHTRVVTKEIRSGHLASSLARRAVIRRLGLLGVSAAGVSGLVSACGSGRALDSTHATRFNSPPAPQDSNTADLGESSVGAVSVLGAGDGITNDRSALEAADEAAQKYGVAIMLLPGVHRISGSITINAPVVARTGGMLKPDRGTIITLAGGIRTGQHQIIDMSDDGVVVPQKVDAFHPAWWGPIGTTNDTATWTKMLVSASYLTAGQVIYAPEGVTRVWQLSLRDVHLEGFGRTRRILPALDVSAAGDPKNDDTGYIVKLAGTTTVNGIDFSTDNVEGITAVFWVGSRVWMANGRIKPVGANTVGVWAYVQDASITPKMLNMWIEGNAASECGVGIRYESSDGELSNITVARCSNGIELLRGSASLVSVHVWECTGNGIIGDGANSTRLTSCYIEKNGGWGADFSDSSYVVVDAGTRFWDNGKSVAGTGGMRLKGGDGFNAEDNRVDASFDDNTGCGVALDGASRTTGDILVISSLVKAGQSPACTDGLYIGAASVGTDMRVRGPGTSQDTAPPVTGNIVNNQNP